MAAQRGGSLRGAEANWDPEGLQDVGGPARGGDGAIAMLGDHDAWASSSSNQRGRRGDIEGAGEIGPGAAGVNQEHLLGLVERDRRGGGAHGVDEAGDLAGSFAAAGCEGAEDAGELDGVRAGGEISFRMGSEDRFQQGAGILARENLTLLDDAVQIEGQGRGRTVSVVSSQL